MNLTSVTTQPQAEHRGVGVHHSRSPFDVRARQDRIERDVVLVEEPVPLVPRNAASFVVLDLALKVDEPFQRHLEPLVHTTCVPRSGLKKLVRRSTQPRREGSFVNAGEDMLPSETPDTQCFDSKQKAISWA